MANCAGCGKEVKAFNGVRHFIQKKGKRHYVHISCGPKARRKLNVK